jgi:hypothetical protein
VRTPIWGRGLPERPKLVNITHAKIRAVGEQAMATLMAWRLLRKLRCSTNRITPLVRAVVTLHHASSAR